MNCKVLLLGLFTASLVSCSTAYKAGQTPDDVYYSPAREAVTKKEKEKDRYEDVVRNEDDQYLRMKVRNRNRWSTIDDYDYWYDGRYDFGCYNYNYYGRNNWNLGYGRPIYNNGYHPGYYGYPIIITKGTPLRPSNVNRPALGGYKNNTGYNNSNGLGNSFKKVISSSNSTYNNGNSGNSNTYNSPASTPSRTYTPSSGSSSTPSSSGSSSSGSSSGGVSRPARGGN